MNGTNGNEPGYPENALVPYPCLLYTSVPNDPDALQSLLQEERRSREQLPPGDFKAHIAALRDGLIETDVYKRQHL